MFAQRRNGIMPAALITSANINLVAHVTLRRVHCSPAAPVLGDKGYKCFEQLLFIKCLTLRLTCTETFKGKKSHQNQKNVICALFAILYTMYVGFTQSIVLGCLGFIIYNIKTPPCLPIRVNISSLLYFYCVEKSIRERRNNDLGRSDGEASVK